MHILPQHLVAVYDCLRVLPPFSSVKFPDADELQFKAVPRPDICAEFIEWDPHIITVSTLKTSHLDTLMQSMAHEMVHLWQSIDGTVGKAQHNANWKKKAARVCREMGWDPLNF